MAKALAEDGYLKPEHHILYAILRSRDWHAGFPPLSSPKSLAARLAPGGIPEPGINARWAINRLFTYVLSAEESKEEKGVLNRLKPKSDMEVRSRKTKKERVEKFLEPFGGTVTPEMLIEVYDDHFERLW